MLEAFAPLWTDGTVERVGERLGLVFSDTSVPRFAQFNGRNQQFFILRSFLGDSSGQFVK